MPNRLLIVFLFLLCGHTAARTQNISKAIIGDTVFVGKYDIVEIGNSLWTNPCKGSEVDGVNWYGPYDDPKNIFIFILNKGIFSVYFHPKSTDTIKSCTYFEVLYKNYSRGCTGGSGRFDMCFSGYGIPTDSLVLIRPQQESFTLLPSAIQKRYSGILVVQVSNNTNSIVSLKSTSLFADSLSLITLDSVMDSTGKRLAVIPPFANRMKVLISLSSKRGPVLKDETYSSSINFLLSRLGIDSIYTNTPTLTLPRPNNLGLTSMQDSLVFHSTVGEK
ncbi:MAG TPA: hypothetical protein VFO76_05315, partial [Candidatus Kapabacteria bacterium]|nr:hypothetical protein [Candidatus Kapabacteria bacterium]